MSFERKELTPEELAAKVAREEELAPKLEAEFGTFADRGTTPYMVRKLIPRLYGARIRTTEQGHLVLAVPLRDAEGKFWNYQRIFSDKFEQKDGKKADKFGIKGARVKGAFHLIGEIAPEGAIYFAEGFATGSSIHQALGENAPVVVALSAPNLPIVALALAEKYPKATFVLCADNDQWKPAKGNAGRRAAETTRDLLMAQGIRAEIRYPVFPKAQVALGEKGGTDFNDIHVDGALGLEEVKRQLLAQAEEDRDGPPVPAVKAAGAAEAALVGRVLDQFEGRLIRQGKDFFRWEDTHWRHLDPISTPDHFKKLIDFQAGGAFKFKDISSAYNRFLLHVPQVPEGVNMFAPDPLKQNFANGTLVLHPQPNGSFTYGLREFRREDWLIHQHPFAYDLDAPLNAEFEATLDRIWEGDPDKEAKKLAYFEILGACLIPAFRKVVLFVGQPKTGKSTLVLFATRLVDERFQCSIDPSQFKKFNLSTAAGKLLNFDTDINLVEPIADSILKKIEDRIPMRIERKGLPDIYAPIPGMHLFACNRMPRSSEGGEAYDRRMIVLKCEQVVQGTQIQDFAGHVWAAGPQGIVARALMGLGRLCSSGGNFASPESSKAAIAEWQVDQGDLVQNFVAEVKAGNVASQNDRIMWHDAGRMKPGDVWQSFRVWVESSTLNRHGPTRYKLYARLRDMGIAQVTIKGHAHYVGFCPQIPEDSDC